MQGIGIGFGIDRDGRDAHAPGAADNAAGDFASVCNQYLIEHF
jgi:hypothetical protein